MLNEASIDIDKEPLGDYKNDHIGIDDAEDVEEEGGDDELEEVDAGTYEDAASKKKIALQEGRQTTPRWKMKL
jgi:hypothetical protein